jgi:hypothetical protein
VVEQSLRYMLAASKKRYISFLFSSRCIYHYVVSHIIDFLCLFRCLLTKQVTEELLHAAFIPFGNIQEVHIPRDFKEGQ